MFVTGKGGVGKTTIAAALALLAARAGRRTLVCEVDAKGTLAAAYESGPLTFAPRQVADRLQAMAMNTEDSLREYLSLQLFVVLKLDLKKLYHFDRRAGCPCDGNGRVIISFINLLDVAGGNLIAFCCLTVGGNNNPLQTLQCQDGGPMWVRWDRR